MQDCAVIFDMDGVIVHTNPYHEEAFKAFFNKYQVRFSEDDFMEHMYGKHNSYILSHFFGRSIAGDELTLMENEKESMFRELFKDFVVPIDGYMPFLNQLKDANIPTGVATSAPRDNMKLIIGQLDLNPLMGSLMASEDVTRHKPDPEIYLQSAANLGMEPERCVVFEDSFSGVTAARAAGTKVVGVLSTHSIQQLPPCDHYIRDYTDLQVEVIADLVKR